MTLLTFSPSPARAGTRLEAWLVLGSVALLSGLAVADRLAAWLIGEFPTSALLWQVRFEFLRPIGVFYDIAAMNLGTLSPVEFSALMLIAGTLIAGCASSRIRLARALSCHLLLAAALVLNVFSLDPGQGVRGIALVGNASGPYALLGAVLALTAGTLCLRVHAEYLGFDPTTALAFRRLRTAASRARPRLGTLLSDLLVEFNARQKSKQIALLPLRVIGSNRFRR